MCQVESVHIKNWLRGIENLKQKLTRLYQTGTTILSYFIYITNENTNSYRNLLINITPIASIGAKLLLASKIRRGNVIIVDTQS